MSLFGHKHRYEAVAVDHKPGQGLLAIPPRLTIVLFRCRCGEVYSKVIDGKWTLGQVRGEDEPSAQERIETDLAVEAVASHEAATPAASR
jgi:hypothetical protein